ncbi:Rieske (2Fe-2S) protein [Roseofilum sp. BLCC_M91]|uniref:Rieske (2Fe-2S) protein n=1 Tax=Roseofilum halophilum BLCC-M91 TaxID=3022259 RepID=A0ABT7BP66_9CYAN|nr:Rieske (2Fe-2S) protein [Roseofilum halophilum]MDJ1180988.1 Rieske (2Fe-2S) protein [Roseofilum halophilum BLCC-M91]
MERRYFIRWMTLSALASLLPPTLSACDSGETPPTPSSNNSPDIDTSMGEDGFQALGTIPQLEAQGTILDRRNAPKSVLIFRHPDTQAIVALNPMCTHQGCTVELSADENRFQCPCHGSQFGLDGAVLSPPAEKPLPYFEVKQEGDLILVKAQ